MEEVKEYKNIKPKVALWLLVIIILGVVFFNNVQIKIPDGYIGVLNRAGRIEKIYSSGIHLRIPFIDKIDVRWGNVRRFEGTIDCFTKEHIEVELDFMFLYRPNSFDSLMYLEKNYGDDDYIEEEFVKPMVYQTIRSKIANTKLMDIVPKASELVEEIQQELNEITKKAYIYESSDFGKTYKCSDELDTFEIFVSDDAQEVEITYGEFGKIDGFMLESNKHRRKVVAFESSLLFLQSNFSNIYYPLELDDALRKIELEEALRKEGIAP